MDFFHTFRYEVTIDYHLFLGFILKSEVIILKTTKTVLDSTLRYCFAYSHFLRFAINFNSFKQCLRIARSSIIVFIIRVFEIKFIAEYYIYIYIYIYIFLLVTVFEGDQKAPFLIATTLRCREGRYSFPCIYIYNILYILYIYIYIYN